MAVENPLNNNENSNESVTPTTGANVAPVNSISAPEQSSVVPPTGNPMTSQRRASGPVGSGRFSNLRKYIGANEQYNQAGGGLAGKVAEVGQKQLGVVQKGISGQGGLKSQVEQKGGQLVSNLGTTAQDLSQDVFSNAEQYVKPVQTVQGQQQAPQTLTEQDRQNRMSEFSKLRTGGYNQDVQALGTGADRYDTNLRNLGQAAANAATETGRFSLLRERFAQPGYSTGQQRLDQLLLQGTQGSAKNLRQKMEQAATQGLAERQGLTNTISGYTQQLGGDTGLVAQRQREIQNLLRTGNIEGLSPQEQLGQMGYEDINKSLEARLNEVKTNLPKTYDELLNAATTNNYSDALAQMTGLTSGQNIYNLNLQDYLMSRPDVESVLATAKPQQLATAADINRYNALQQLAGLGGEFFQGVDPTKIEQFNPINLDKERLQKDLASRQERSTELTGDIGEIGKNLMDMFNKQDAGGYSYNSEDDPASREAAQLLLDFQNNPSQENLARLKNRIETPINQSITGSSFAKYDITQEPLYKRTEQDLQLRYGRTPTQEEIVATMDPSGYYRNLYDDRNFIARQNIGGRFIDEKQIQDLLTYFENINPYRQFGIPKDTAAPETNDEIDYVPNK